MGLMMSVSWHAFFGVPFLAAIIVVAIVVFDQIGKWT